MSGPRGLLVAAPRSGGGKTTLTLALLAALRRRGIVVRGAKSGPDYLDPAFHEAASGAPSLTLDSWAMPPALLRATLDEAADGAELLVVESAMGLFDGAGREPGRSGSAADLAAAFALPVLLVLDVSGQSQSAAAVARGFATHRPGVRIAGVVLNRVGSPRHRDGCASALAEAGIPVLGAISRDPALSLPERHLGLVQAREQDALPALLQGLAEMAERDLDLGAILALAAPLAASPAAPSATRPAAPAPAATPLSDTAAAPLAILQAVSSATPLVAHSTTPAPAVTLLPNTTVAPPAVIPIVSPINPAPTRPTSPLPVTATVSPAAPPAAGLVATARPASARGNAGALRPPGQRIAVADDRAFSFLYPHLGRGWHAQGAELVRFSPLADEPPPEDCDCCWLPGGYPELHAPALSAATRFLSGLARFAETRPVHGECGGHMVLGRTLTDADGTEHVMAGLLSHATSFARRRLHLGYREATLLQDGVLGRAGSRLRGHEFHYAVTTDAGNDAPLASLRDAAGNALGPAGNRRGLVSGSFFHVIAAQGSP